jgi:hypothetical protein
MDAQLMGSAGDRPQGQLGGAAFPLQDRELCAGGFTITVYITQKTGKRTAGNGGVDHTGIFLRTAID